MAQDFRSAFSLGEDDKHITTVDEEGVALAAIQGLNQRVNDQAAQLKEKDAEIQALKESVEALKIAVSNIATKAQMFRQGNDRR